MNDPIELHEYADHLLGTEQFEAYEVVINAKETIEKLQARIKELEAVSQQFSKHQGEWWDKEDQLQENIRIALEYLKRETPYVNSAICQLEEEKEEPNE